MEVKINREIRNYTESMFFGLSLRQFIFFCSRLCGSGRTLLSLKTVPRNRNRIVGVYFGSCPFCGSRLCEIQRNDG